jgi:hypothetical protein
MVYGSDDLLKKKGWVPMSPKPLLEEEEEEAAAAEEEAAANQG